MKIIYDTREKKNDHILDRLKKSQIETIKEKLDFGDYSLIDSGINYKNKIVVERKSSIDEFAMNCTARRKQFIAEMKRAKEARAIFILLLENSSINDIVRHNYRSKMHPNAMLGSLRSWKLKYDIKVFFLKDNKYSAQVLYSFFKNHVIK